jgi:TolB-like protein/cytochrome c-type biogenesis protein CcmH/NrfG
LGTLRSDLIDPTIAVHHGRIVKRTGDGSILEFRSVVDAVNCAIEVQRAMVERNAEVAPDKRIEFRIGIHLGDVVQESDGDLMGDGVNIAARLEGVAKPGAICLSEDAYRQVSGRLDMAVTDLGPTQLKNIERPIRAYSLQVGVPAQAKPATNAKPPASKKPSSLAILAAGIVALLILIAGGAWWFLGDNRTAPVAANAPPPLAAQRFSLVVLPFANLTGDPAQDYLADALTDGLTTALTRLPDGFVIARNTAFTYKGKSIDAKAIGRDLGVRYVLEGSVLPSGDQVRVNAQFIEADSGAHLWADQFDTPRADLLQMQDTIVARLGRAMNVQLTEAEAARLKRTPAANPNAEDLALQCKAAVQKHGLVGKEAEPGMRLCEQALALDPNNVRALSLLAAKLGTLVGHGLSADRAADLKRMDELASQALALDPNYSFAHYAKGGALNMEGRLDEGIVEFERTLALDPTAVSAYMEMGWSYFYPGQFEKSLALADKAIRISPYDYSSDLMYLLRAMACIGLKQYDQAIESARRAIGTKPSNSWAHLSLVAALALGGHEAEAHEALQIYLASVPSGPKTIAAVKAAEAVCCSAFHAPGYLELNDRRNDGLRKAGMPEGEAKTN